MSTRAADYLEAIVRLPEGATLVIHQVDWDDYESVLEDVSGRHSLRISYDGGRLEILSPLPEHEEYARFIETNQSSSKLPIYASLFVPEIWRYDGEKAEFLRIVHQWIPPDSGKPILFSVDARDAGGGPDAKQVGRADRGASLIPGKGCRTEVEKPANSSSVPKCRYASKSRLRSSSTRKVQSGNASGDTELPARRVRIVL